MRSRSLVVTKKLLRFENLVPGVYTVKVSDSDGCYVEQNVTVGSNDKLPQ